MDDPSAAELRALQSRIYGPDADLRDDAGALRRLEELEHRGGMRAAVTSDAGPKAAATPRSATQTPEAPAPAPEPSTELPVEVVVVPAPPPRRSRATLAALWTVSIVVACVAAVGASQVLAPPGPRQVATLSVDPDAPWPAWLMTPQEGIDIFEDYHGLTVIAAPTGLWGKGDSARCIVVIVTEGQEYLGDGCGAGTFPATTHMLITDTSPASLRETFGEGTALQFVLEDDSTVTVRTDAE